MTIPLLPFINKLTDHLVSIRSDRWTSPHDPGPKLMAGRERVIENDGWHWEESPEGPQGAITCLIPLQINAGTNPKTDTSRQNLIRLPFLSSPSKLCPLAWQPWSFVPILFTSRTSTDVCKMQSEAAVFPTARSPAPFLTWQCHREAQSQIYLNTAGLGVEGRSNDTNFPLPCQIEKLMSTLLLPLARQGWLEVL